MREAATRLAAIGAATIVATASLAGCARESNGTIDAPVGRQDNTPADIINMPNHWRNIATKCVAFQPGKRIYEPRTHGDYPAVPVIVDDPSCKG